MASASSCSAARTTSSTLRLWPRWMTSAPWAWISRRMMLMAASCPSNRLAAVTKRSGEVSGWVWLSWLAGVPMARSGMISDDTDCSVGGSGGLLGRHAAQADRTPGALRRAGWKPPGGAARCVMPHSAPTCPSYATKPLDSMKKRIKRILAWGLFSLTLLVGSGILLADRLMPPATGAPGMVLPVVPGQTALDRELEPLLARNPGKTAALLVPDGLDAFASRAISARQAGR